jgi:predicted small metal-binding protein
MKESITHLQAFITELVNEAVQVALEQHQETAITEMAENNLKSEILNADQAAEFLHIAKQTLYSMTSRRKIPFYKNFRSG